MRMVVVEGKLYPSITAACSEYNVITNAVYAREKRGITVEQAILDEVAYCKKHGNDSVARAIERDKAEEVGLTAPYIRRVAKRFDLSYEEAIPLAIELKQSDGCSNLKAQQYLFCRHYKIADSTYRRILERLGTRDLAEQYIKDILEDAHIVVFGDSIYNNFAALCETYPVIQYNKLLHRKLLFNGSFEELVHKVYWVVDGVPYRLLRDACRVLGIPSKTALAFSRRHAYTSHDEAIKMLQEMISDQLTLFGEGGHN